MQKTEIMKSTIPSRIKPYQRISSKERDYLSLNLPKNGHRFIACLLIPNRLLAKYLVYRPAEWGKF